MLRALSSVEQSEVMMLADATHLLAPSLSRILHDLETQTLVARRADPDDLRRNFVSITPEGISLINQAGAYSEIIYKQLTEKYGPKKLHDLLDLLLDLEHCLNEGAAFADGLIESETDTRPKTSRPRGRPKKK